MEDEKREMVAIDERVLDKWIHAARMDAIAHTALTVVYVLIFVVVIWKG